MGHLIYHHKNVQFNDCASHGWTDPEKGGLGLGEKSEQSFSNLTANPDSLIIRKGDTGLNHIAT